MAECHDGSTESEEKKYCSHPTCYKNSEDSTLYKEPTEHNERGWFAVCGEHADLQKEGVEVIVNDAASELSGEILKSLK